MSFWSIVEWLPISSYPVRRDFHRRWLVVVIGAASAAVFVGLTIWNVLTQGKTAVFISQFHQTIPATSTNPSVTCSSTRLKIGDVFFSSNSPPGNFTWLLNNVDTGSDFATGVNYREQLLTSTNITSIGLTYVFAVQTYNFGVCANATVRAPMTNDASGPSTGSWEESVLGLCTNFDLASSNLPSWTHTATQRIEDRVFGLSQFYQSLSFPNGTFPSSLIPPYGDQGAPPPNDTTISPARIIGLNVFMGGFQYLPASDASGQDTDLPTGIVHDILGSDGQSHTLLDTFNIAVKGHEGELGLTVGGIGNVHLDTQSLNNAIGFTEPQVITQMRNYTLDTLNLIMDMASSDLNAKQLGVSYLCTSTSYQWKTWLEMISMILGNNAALFGFAFAAMITLARWYELRRSGADHVEAPWTSGSSARGFRPLGDLDAGGYATREESSRLVSHVDFRAPPSL